jgi:hypothetical protein
MLNFMKIYPVGAELFHAEGRTDTMKLKVAFCNFAKAPMCGIQILGSVINPFRSYIGPRPTV